MTTDIQGGSHGELILVLPSTDSRRGSERETSAGRHLVLPPGGKVVYYSLQNKARLETATAAVTVSLKTAVSHRPITPITSGKTPTLHFQ